MQTMTRSIKLSLDRGQKQTTLWRAAWLIVACSVLFIMLLAAPVRFNQLINDPYNYGALLDALGLSTRIFAIYFVTLEVLFGLSFLTISAVIAWQKAGEPVAMLVAFALPLWGLVTPLIDPLLVAYPAFHWPLIAVRILALSSLLIILLVFPDGRFVPRWSWWLLITWLAAITLGNIFYPPGLADTAIVPNTRTQQEGLLMLSANLWFLAGVGAQLYRYRRISGPQEKQQTKWVLAGLAAAVGIAVLSLTILTFVPTVQYLGALHIYFVLTFGAFLLIGATMIPLSLAVAILRSGLWDIDVLIGRTLVYGALTAIIIGLYIIVVGGLSLIFQAQGGLFFALVATGLIAVLFQPLRARLHRSANRLLYGQRDDPYQLLSQLGRRLQTTAAPDTLLQSTVETIGEALKLPYVAIDLFDAEGPLGGATFGSPRSETETIPLRYRSETVGRLLVSLRGPGEPFTAKEGRLLEDIAGQTGALAYGLRVTAALQRSRERLVLAREEERRRIRRDLHDGLGPALASQTFQLDAAIDLLETDPEAAGNVLTGLKSRNQSLVADIRRLVYELQPPVLEELGLVPALQTHSAQLQQYPQAPEININATPDPLPRLPAAVEVAAYRIVLEAITNVVRHAGAQSCLVRLIVQKQGTGRLTIDIDDDGRGLSPERKPGLGLPSMRERAAELGGTVSIVGRAQRGTAVRVSLPLPSR